MNYCDVFSQPFGPTAQRHSPLFHTEEPTAGSFSPWAPTAHQTILWHVATVQPLGLLCGEGNPETVENVYSGIPLPTHTHTHTLPFRKQSREREYGARPPSKCCSSPSDLSCSLEFCSHSEVCRGRAVASGVPTALPEPILPLQSSQKNSIVIGLLPPGALHLDLKSFV